MLEVQKLLRILFILETSGYDFKRALQKAPQEGPKAGWDTALAMSIDGPKDGQLVDQQPVGEFSSMYTHILKL